MQRAGAAAHAMCGLTGFFRAAGLRVPDSEAVLRRQTDQLSHRGPDDAGVWFDHAAGIALGHRRLAVIDLSPAGRQPMISPSGRYVVVYNGEIYNHLEIRAELENTDVAVWRGHSDTETLLAAIERWGVEAALTRISGMFAFALWDREQRTLTLARDRMGEKPLYYGWAGDTLMFGSELKALRAHSGFDPAVDRDALAQLVGSGYIAAPASIFVGIRKLLPGHTVQVSSATPAGTLPAPHAWWSLHSVVSRGLARPFTGSATEAVAQLKAELAGAIQRQSISDVPLGAFLSGGIDSTIVVALLQAQSNRRVRTFTVGFHESAYQEAQHAAVIAAHLGTEHADLYVSAADARQIIPTLPAMFDEPFGDSSAIPTHLVARFARQHVTVCLSGDGGDELFGGYTRYRGTKDIWRLLSGVPLPVRTLIARSLNLLPRRSRADGARVERLVQYLAARSAGECYRVKVTQWKDANSLVHGASRLAPPGGPSATLADEDLYAYMMYADTASYLPDDILAKVDRAAMAVSLETRIPLLDPRIVEFAWSLPFDMKVRDGKSKWILRRLLADLVPEHLFERPKKGFSVPVGQWMRGPLRDWAEDLLAEPRLRREGFFDVERVRERWRRHLVGAGDSADSLWPVLMFQAWLSEPVAPASRAVA